MTLLHSAGRFAYDFIIGDDWKIATAVLSALLTGTLLLTVGVPPGVTALVSAGLLAAAFTTAMVIDVWRTPPHQTRGSLG